MFPIALVAREHKQSPTHSTSNCALLIDFTIRVDDTNIKVVMHDNDSADRFLKRFIFLLGKTYREIQIDAENKIHRA